MVTTHRGFVVKLKSGSLPCYIIIFVGEKSGERKKKGIPPFAILLNVEKGDGMKMPMSD